MPKTHIAKNLHALREQIRDVENSHKELFRCTFVEKTLSCYEGINHIVRNGQQLQELCRQEKALAKLAQR